MFENSDQTDSHLNLDMQTGLQDSFQHMTLGYQVLRPLGPIKGTMDIIHYLQSCLQRFGEPKLTCPHLFSNILFVFYSLPSFIYFFFESLDLTALGAKPMITKGAGLERRLSY